MQEWFSSMKLNNIYSQILNTTVWLIVIFCKVKKGLNQILNLWGFLKGLNVMKNPTNRWAFYNAKML